MFGVEKFDIVIGNPPYVQLQGKLAKEYKDKNFKSFTSTGDLYQLFYEKGLDLLSRGGVLCFITSNKWMRAAYGQKLRQHFADIAQVVQLIDLGSGIFKATVDTNILLLKKYSNKRVKSKAYKMQGSQFNSIEIKDTNVTFNVPPSGGPWLILSKEEQKIKEKIEKVGTPLKEWDINIYRGILTGYNPAFIIDNETKERLTAEDPKSAEILKPVLRGRDIKRYRADWAELWLIGTMPSLKIDIERYPAIKKHLLSFGQDRLEQTGTTLQSGVKSRKKTIHQWFELQDSCAYHAEFKNDKIIYPNISSDFVAHYDTLGYLTNQKCFILTGNNLEYLTLFFNSQVNNFYYKTYLGATLGASGYEMNKVFVNEIPVPKPTELRQQEAHKIIHSSQLSIKVANDFIYKAYEFTNEEMGVIKSGVNYLS